MSDSGEDDAINVARRCLLEGDFGQARELIAPKLEEARQDFAVAARRMVELLLLHETAVAAAATAPGENLRQAITLCEEAIRISESARLDASTRINALSRAATRYGVEGPPTQAVALLRKALSLSDEPLPDVDVAWMRTSLVADLLSAGDVEGALSEVESWSSWGIDALDLWLVAETLFRAGRSGCLPVLERMLRDRDSWDDASIAQLEGMTATARSWGSSP